MSTWPVQDAKARFSEFLKACLTNGPQTVTRRGQETAVLVPVAQWHQLQANAKPSLKQVLLDSAKLGDLVIAPRRLPRRRAPAIF